MVEQQLALSAGGFFSVRLQPSLFEVYAELRPGKTAAEGEQAIDAVLAKLAAEGPAERELQKAKNQLEARFVKRLKTNNGAGEALGFHEHVYGGYEAMFGAIDRYRKVTAADCRRVAKQVFDPLRRTVAAIVPETRDANEGGGR